MDNKPYNNTEVAEGYKLIVGYLGIVTMLVGFINLLPLLTLFAYKQEVANAKYFTIPGTMAVLVGYLFTFFVKGKEKGKLHKNQDAIIVVGSWIIAIFVSALTTTGFQTVLTFTTWSSPLLLLMIIMQLIGGGTGSTAGGIKQFRVYIVLKEMWWRIRQKFAHKRIIRVNKIERFGQKEIVDDKFKLEINIIFLGLIRLLSDIKTKAKGGQ